MIYRMDNRSALRFPDRRQRLNASFVIFILYGLNRRKHLLKLKRKLEHSPVLLGHYSFLNLIQSG